MFCQIYKYFEPDTIIVFDEPIAPAKRVDKFILKRIEILQVQKSRLDKNQRQQNIYYKEYNIYQYEKKDQEKFNKIDAKLRKQILITVTLQKKGHIIKNLYCLKVIN